MAKEIPLEIGLLLEERNFWRGEKLGAGSKGSQVLDVGPSRQDIPSLTSVIKSPAGID